MTPYQIKSFKEFLKRRGVNTIYESLYKTHPLPNNPPTLDMFLENIEMLYAIFLAFDFNKLASSGSKYFHRRYWYALNTAWIKVYMKSEEQRYKDTQRQSDIDLLDAGLEQAVKNADKKEETNDFWSSLTNAVTPKKQITTNDIRPSELLIKKADDHYEIIINSQLSSVISKCPSPSCCMMRHKQDGIILVFGEGLEVKMRQYSKKGMLICNSKKFVDILINELGVEDNVFYASHQKPIWNDSRTQLAVVLNKSYRKYQY